MKLLPNLLLLWNRLATVLAIGWFLTPGNEVLGQELSSKIGETDQEALRALAQTISPAGSRVDIVLNEVGFSLSAEMKTRWPDFEQWPAVRKIETAYIFAVEAGGATEGQVFLRMTSRIVAQDFSNAVRYEPALKLFFPERQ